MDGCGGRFNFGENNDNGIRSGPCDPYEGCPPPTEIVCIKVDKVYEECKLVQVNTVDTDLSGLVEGCITDVQCIRAELVVDEDHPRECVILPCQRVRASFFYRFKFKWTDDLGEHVFTSDPIKVEKIGRMNRAGETGLDLQCEIFVDCIDCFLINKTTVRCCIGKLVVFKLFAHVQLLIPAYGFCPEPPNCRVTPPEDCPGPAEWLETIVWPPFYPEQDR
ncbi:MAG: hypothetical protein CVU88_00920 [Firmicutes bacterium HGW-Firmicutes-13]|nr:MAG: hypothetical protein CVU88_00920 [Firmicutes bacterium HGW-Firmicutes-13]